MPDAVMIDWVSAVVPVADAGDLHAGRVVSVDADGVMEWATLRRLPVQGSYSPQVMVRGRGDDMMEFSGNPAKFLQGHNVFGPGQLVPLMRRALGEVGGRLGLPASDADRADWAAGAYDLSRVDVTGSIRLDSGDQVRKVLGLLGRVVRTKHQAATVRSDTVYVGQGSRRISLKFYDKGEEIRSTKKGHGLCTGLPGENREKLTEHADGLLRVELTLRGMELRERGLHRASRWTGDVALGLLRERMAALELNDSVVLADDLLDQLPGKLVAVYDAWQAGRDIRRLYSRATFYRYRAALLAYGVDIARVQPRLVVKETQYPLGVPLREILARSFEGPPEWAQGTALLAS
jgi:II/X family phage/plasmid replication protein